MIAYTKSKQDTGKLSVPGCGERYTSKKAMVHEP